MEGGGGGGGGFGYGNLHNNPSLYKPSPPLSAIDRFLWGQSGAIIKNKQTLGLANGFADFSLSSGAIASYGSVGFSWPSSRNDPHIMSFAEGGSFFDEETFSWLHDINLNPNLSLNEEALTAEKNKKKAGRKKVKVGYSSTLIKGQWTEEEDRKLIRLVKQYGERKWAQIADKLVGRAGKQCRERWHNHLRPDIKKDGWSEEEERMLIEAHQMVGNKWAEIAKRIPGRTENSIKNHFNATKRRQNSRRKKKNPKKGGLKLCQQTSILQDYIKSNNNSITPTDSPTTCDHDPMNQSHFFQPEPSQSATDDSPPLIPHTHDDELLFIQNFFASNSHINQPSVVDHDHHSSLTTSNNKNIYRNAIQGEDQAAHERSSAHLYSDMYLSYLLNGGCNTTTSSTYSSCSNHCYYNDEYMSLDLVPSYQHYSSNGRKEMDLIEMVSCSQFSQGSTSSNSNF